MSELKATGFVAVAVRCRRRFTFTTQRRFECDHFTPASRVTLQYSKNTVAAAQ